MAKKNNKEIGKNIFRIMRDLLLALIALMLPNAYIKFGYKKDKNGNFKLDKDGNKIRNKISVLRLAGFAMGVDSHKYQRGKKYQHEQLDAMRKGNQNENDQNEEIPSRELSYGLNGLTQPGNGDRRREQTHPTRAARLRQQSQRTNNPAYRRPSLPSRT